MYVPAFAGIEWYTFLACFTNIRLVFATASSTRFSRKLLLGPDEAPGAGANVP
jgi:hypothetical protein